MIYLLQSWAHDLRCRITGCPSMLDLHPDQETRVRESEQRLERVEDKLDQMIIRKAGPDFLDAALTNQEGDDRGR